MRVFLSGSTHSDWQDRVMKALDGYGVEYFDPRSLSHLTMDQIAAEERSWLKRSDCLLFYFETDNPSGIGSAFEVGYCIAKGIPVIFVDEKNTSHTEWLGHQSDVVTSDLAEGIAQLKRIMGERSAP